MVSFQTFFFKFTNGTLSQDLPESTNCTVAENYLFFVCVFLFLKTFLLLGAPKGRYYVGICS